MKCISCGVRILHSSFDNPQLCEFCGIDYDASSIHSSSFDPYLLI